MKEKDLIQKLREGNTSAYNYLFSEYYSWLCNYMLQLTNDRIIAEDLVQEVLIKFWEKRKTIAINSSLKSYLFKSCYNAFLQHIRSKKIQFDRLDKMHWEVVSEATFENSLTETDIRLEKLHSLINQLPLRCRQIFILNKLNKKKYKEIALDMGISIKTVENQMSKALHFLRENAVLLIFMNLFYS